MKNYISNFDTTAQYEAAKEMLDKPHVSLVEEDMSVHYDPDYSNYDGYLRLVFEDGRAVDITDDDIYHYDQGWETTLNVNKAKQAIFGTSCTNIPGWILSGMDNLGEVVISSTVETIGDSAFPNTLHSITFIGTVAPTYKKNAFASQIDWGTVHFPPCVIQGYENWINEFEGDWGWNIDYGHPTEYESNNTIFMIIDKFPDWATSDIQDYLNGGSYYGARILYFTGETIEYNGNNYYIWTQGLDGVVDSIVNGYVLTESADYDFLYSKSLDYDISSTYAPAIAVLHLDTSFYRDGEDEKMSQFRIVNVYNV